MGAGARDGLLGEQILDRIWLYGERCVYEQISCIHSIQVTGIMIFNRFNSGDDASPTHLIITTTSL
jgi:hypothetical protein